MNRKPIFITLGAVVIVLGVAFLLWHYAAKDYAARDPYVGVWAFPSDDPNKGPSRRALILEKTAFGFVDDWKDRKHTTPISGVWSIVNGVLVLKVQHTEMGEVRENSEMRWKIVVTGDLMRVTFEDGSPAVVLERLPAEFDTTIILPDSTRYKVNEEFKYEPQSDKELLSKDLPKKLIQGSYLGKAHLDDREYYKYQFLDILKGAGRRVNLYLEVPGAPGGKPQHLAGLLQEVQTNEIANAKPVLLFYHYHPNYDKEEVMSHMSHQGFSASELNDYPHYFSCWVWDYEQTFICYPPFDWPQVDSWNCTIEVQRSR